MFSRLGFKQTNVIDPLSLTHIGFTGGEYAAAVPSGAQINDILIAFCSQYVSPAQAVAYPTGFTAIHGVQLPVGSPKGQVSLAYKKLTTEGDLTGSIDNAFNPSNGIAGCTLMSLALVRPNRDVSVAVDAQDDVNGNSSVTIYTATDASFQPPFLVLFGFSGTIGGTYTLSSPNAVQIGTHNYNTVNGFNFDSQHRLEYVIASTTLSRSATLGDAGNSQAIITARMKLT